jgi:hypothetical protein
VNVAIDKRKDKSGAIYLDLLPTSCVQRRSPEVEVKKQFVLRALVVCGVTVMSASLALAGDNWLGTWKLNGAKSKYSPGPAPQSATLKFDPAPDGITLSQDLVDAKGKATAGGYTSKFDGTEVPYAGNPDADTCTPKRVDDNIYLNTWKKAGKVTINAKVVASGDGKTLTVTQTGKNAKGQTVHNVAVYDKQ